jgi:hypothetical protein
MLSLCSSPSHLPARAEEPAQPQSPLSAMAGDTAPVPLRASGRANYIEEVRRQSLKWRLPPEIADAVVQMESGYNPNLMGGVGEVGLMQLRPPTAAMMGFGGTAASLADPATNIDLGVRYLAGAWQLAGGDPCRALTKYRAGHGAEWVSPLSATYCQRARAYLISIGSPLAAQFKPVTAGAADPLAQPAGPGASVSRATPRFAALGSRTIPWYKPGGRLRTAHDSVIFWAAQAARIKTIRARIEAGWRMRSARG